MVTIWSRFGRPSECISTSPVATSNRLDLTTFSGTIGLPVPNTDITIRDDDEKILPPGQVGEICIAGPQVMKGYWQRPEETAKVMTKDGPTNVTTEELFKGKKVVLFSVPGAFTPTCNAKHLPGFVEHAAAIRAKGGRSTSSETNEGRNDQSRKTVQHRNSPPKVT